jgi:hypothetical protein
MIRLRPLLAPAAALTLGACAGGPVEQYPSLAHRPVEELGFAEPVVEAAVAAPDPALDGQIAQLETRLQTIAAGFDRDATAAAQAGAAARGRAVGSEAWLSAQSALAELDDWRAQGSALAAEADALAIARARALQPPYPALAEATKTVQAEIERQAGEIARLSALTPAV